jgi:hypothetical protein
MAISDGITNIQKSIDMLISQRIQDFSLADRIRQYTESDMEIKQAIKAEAEEEHVDLLICIVRSEHFEPEPQPEQIEAVWNGYIAWNNAVENVCSLRNPILSAFANNHRLIKRCDIVQNSLLISNNCSNSTCGNVIRP